MSDRFKIRRVRSIRPRPYRFGGDAPVHSKIEIVKTAAGTEKSMSAGRTLFQIFYLYILTRYKIFWILAAIPEALGSVH